MKKLLTHSGAYNIIIQCGDDAMDRTKAPERTGMKRQNSRKFQLY